VESNASRHILSKIQILFLRDRSFLKIICDVLLDSKACSLQSLLGLSFSTDKHSPPVHGDAGNQTFGLKEAIYIILQWPFKCVQD
jgi:hypothetical protein